MRRRGLIRAAVCALGILAAVLGAAAAANAIEPQDVLRGVDDQSLFRMYRPSGTGRLNELSAKLRAQVIRADIPWTYAEPRRGQYNEAYLDQVAATIAEARARGLQVVVLVYRVPEWASDRSFWDAPVAGDRPGEYRSYFPMRLDRLPDFQAFAQHLATKLAGNVLAYEAWCEPNMWRYLYPQRTEDDDLFAVHRYARMLEAFSAGVRAADPAALVAAGATAPTGRNNRYGTSPQRFARRLKALGVESLFDVYTHHPYVPGGTKNTAPEQPPSDPGRTVTLGNISTLLDVFPDKPYYMTEFGYSTRYSHLFGITVTPAQQAGYLRRAYRLMAEYPQIRLGIWFPYRDHSSTDTYRDLWGVYSGLRTIGGDRKPAYYAFAGGNLLTLRAPGSIARGDTLTLRGRLTSASMGPLAGKRIQILGKRPGRRWVIVRYAITRKDGTYVVRLDLADSASWKARWPGVVDSQGEWVPVGS